MIILTLYITIVTAERHDALCSLNRALHTASLLGIKHTPNYHQFNLNKALHTASLLGIKHTPNFH